MILMPGFDGTGELFSPLTTALSPRHRPTVIRYRDERTFDDYVETVSAALPDQGAILVAESFSGPVALALMARHPEKIQCAVLCATFVESPFHALTQLARFVPSPLFGLDVGHRAMLQQFCLDDRCNPALMDQALAVIKSMPAAAVGARLNVLAQLQVRTFCRNIRTQDVEGPHLLLQSRPQECAQLIEEFVATVPGIPVSMRS